MTTDDATDASSAAGPELGWQLTRLLDGFIVTQLLYVAARLDVVSALSAGPRTGAELASAVGAETGPLTRVMRGLVAEGVFSQDAAGRFALTPLGAALGGLRGAAIARGELYYHPAEALFDAVREGGVAFERTHAASFFDHLGAHPDQEAVFQASMAGRADNEAEAVVAAYDFSGSQRIIDVGGGRGVLLAAILRRHPEMTAALLDREAAIGEARGYLDRAGLRLRAECVVGDFFAAVPAGADTYLLSRVLHDWGDADAERILTVCRRAMPADGRLLVVDAVLPERAEQRPAAIRMDLHMLLLFGTAERTRSEFEQLLERCALEITDVRPTSSPAGLAVIEARPVAP